MKHISNHLFEDLAAHWVGQLGEFAEVFQAAELKMNLKKGKTDITFGMRGEGAKSEHAAK